MKALVTGGRGFLGRYIIEKLLEKKWSVSSLSRLPDPELLKLGVPTITASVTDKAALVAACAGMDVVFHVAAKVGMGGPWSEFYKTNVIGTQNVIKACLHNGVTRLVYTSSPSVVFDGNDHDLLDESTPYPTKYLAHYPETKAMAEREVLRANGRDGLLTCSLRPHLVWGPRDTNLIPRLIDRAKKGKVKIIGDGNNVVSNVYVENAADAHLLAAEKLAAGSPASGSPVAGSTYFIAQPEPVKLWDWINEILEGLDLPRVTRKVPFGVAYTAGGAMELVYRALGLRSEPMMTRFLAQQLARNHHYSIEKARRELGWEPAIGHKEGMARLIADFKGGQSQVSIATVR
ncbi:MAG: NAD-dependent epimerase/dehydratase family protein [Nitrospinota bacterium]|nr:NAD-dependent epimerase/dehydratase family protein [Nitrospinota bacterium]